MFSTGVSDFEDSTEITEADCIELTEKKNEIHSSKVVIKIQTVKAIMKKTIIWANKSSNYSFFSLLFDLRA